MKKSRQMMVLMLSAAMSLGLFGCGEKVETAKPTGNAEGKAELQKEASSDKTVDQELTVWCWDENYNIPIMKTAARYYQEAGHPDFRVNIINVPDNDVRNKAITAFASGVSEGLPDILLMDDYSAKSFLNSYPDQFADLSSSIHAADFAENKAACYTVDGKLYGVPFDSGSAGMYYRTDLFEQAGYTAEDLTDITWKEFAEIARNVKAATGKYVVVFTPYKGTHYMQMALQSAGQWFYAEDGKSPNFKNNEIIRQICEVLKEMYDADVIYPVDYFSSEGVGAVQNGDIAAHLSAVWYIPTLTSAAEMAGKWSYTNLPKLEGIDQATQYSNIGGSSWMVLEGSDNKELAIDFLASVYDGNLDFYDQILEEQGAVATYLAAANSEAYEKRIPYFNDQPICSDFAKWGARIPAVDYGEYTNEACDAIRAVLQDYLDGRKTLDDALEEAETVYKMQVGL